MGIFILFLLHFVEFKAFSVCLFFSKLYTYMDLMLHFRRPIIPEQPITGHSSFASLSPLLPGVSDSKFFEEKCPAEN